MGSIARGFCYIFVIQAVIHQVSSQHQTQIAKYVLSNYGPSNGQQNGFTPTSSASRPNIPLSALTNLVGTAPVPSPIQSPITKAPFVPNPELSSGPLNSNVLNNLAIALQLLIVSNIMNIPAEPVPELSKLTSKYELSPIPKSSPVLSYSASVLEQALSNPQYSYEAQKPLYSYETQSFKPLYYETQSASKPSLYSYEGQIPKPGMFSYEAQSLPNANFLGSSGFAEPVFGPSMGTVRPNPRSSMTLMSPYDALGTSLFADSSSSFPSHYSKKDFQSPYASILAADGARDLFSVSDLF